MTVGERCRALYRQAVECEERGDIEGALAALRAREEIEQDIELERRAGPHRRES